MKRVEFVIICAGMLACAIAALGQSPTDSEVVVPTQAQLPAWLMQGKIRFARVDGGPIEVQKTMRSSWGKRFTTQEREVLGNLYGEYGDRMADLLKQAHVNFVWVTYSVGFSWQDETAQRTATREFVRKLHSRGIHVAGYMCAVSVFWQSMFKDVPQSVRWIMFNPQGLPFRYSGGRDPLRFIADVRNPEWIDYQEKRIGAMIDDGLDAIFFDNTGALPWASNQSVADFFTKIRCFIHDKKHSNIPLFSNFGLTPARAALNRYMNFTYDESWQEPGITGTVWNVSNIRRDRLLRGMIPPWKPAITEYSIFHNGNRSSTFLSPASVKLSIAESAAFGTAYTWDMEGPFDRALIASNPLALASWSAISQYNGFLEAHSALYVGAVNVTPLLVLIPDEYKSGFGWADSSTTGFFDLLSRHSFLYSVVAASMVNRSELGAYSAVVVPFFSALDFGEKQFLRSYVARGGKLYAFANQEALNGLNCEHSSPALVEHTEANPRARQEIVAKVASLAPEATRISVINSPHVLANLTSLNQGRTIVIHLLNYNPVPAKSLRFRLALGERFSHLIGRQPTIVSPDLQTSGRLINVRWHGRALEATLPVLGTYGIIALK